MAELYIAFAFALGLASFFTPCAVGMVPAYLGYYLGRREKGQSPGRRTLNAIVFGLTTTGGFITVFSMAGFGFLAIDSSLRAAIGPNLALITIAVGVILVVIGATSLFGYALPFTIPVKAPERRNLVGFYIFGIAYALVSFSCNLPLFLGVVSLAVISGGGAAALLILLVYAMGKGTMMTLASLLVALPKQAIDLRRMVRWTPMVKKISAGAMVGAGFFMIGYYAYLYSLLGAPRIGG